MTPNSNTPPPIPAEEEQALPSTAALLMSPREFRIPALPQAEATWTWHTLEDVFQVLSNIANTEIFPFAAENELDLLARYMLLSKLAGQGKNGFTYVQNQQVRTCLYTAETFPKSVSFIHPLYVPAGWFPLVLKVVRAGGLSVWVGKLNSLTHITNDAARAATSTDENHEKVLMLCEGGVLRPVPVA